MAAEDACGRIGYWIPLNKHMANTIAKSCRDNETQRDNEQRDSFKQTDRTEFHQVGLNFFLMSKTQKDQNQDDLNL